MGRQDRAQHPDVWRRFRPTPSQEKFLRCDGFGRLFSSGYGSGKSKTGCREGLRWAISFPGSRGLIGRLTATDLRDTTMVTFWKEMAICGFREGEHYSHNKADREVTFTFHPDPAYHSKIIYRHLDDPEALGSLELNWAFIDEGSEVDDMIYKTLSSSRLRWHLPDCDQEALVNELIEAGAPDEQVAAVPCGCPRGIWVCTNPGGSGYLRSVTQGKVPDWTWIRAKPGDNPYNGPDYYAKMERDRAINGEVWMRKFYEGDWGAFEGQRFVMFDRDRHVLAAPFRPTRDYEILEGWDFGSRETFVVWIAYKPNGIEPVVVFHELQAQNVQDPADVARQVMAIRKEYGVGERVVSSGDPSGVAGTAFSSVGPIAAYAGHGIFIAPAKSAKSPTGRADKIAALLLQSKPQPDGSIWPGLLFGPNCPAVVESVVSLRWKPGNSKIGEDPLERFVKKDDHGVDALGYGLASVPPPEVSAARDPGPRPGVNVDARTAWRMGS